MAQDTNPDNKNLRSLIDHQWSKKLPKASEQILFWAIAAIGLALDLWTKAAVFEWLKQKNNFSHSLIDGFLRLVVAENAGAAFGLASGRRVLLITVSAFAFAVILGVFYFNTKGKKIVMVALALFIAGICGNLYDRIFNEGFVRDFIDIYYRSYHWPAFNVADTMLCAAVGLLIISGFLTEMFARKHSQKHTKVP